MTLQVQGDASVFNLQRINHTAVSGLTAIRCPYTHCTGWATSYKSNLLVKYKCQSCRMRFSIARIGTHTMRVTQVDVKKKRVVVEVAPNAQLPDRQASGCNLTVARKQYACTVCGTFPKRGHVCLGPSQVRCSPAMSVSSIASTAHIPTGPVTTAQQIQTLKDVVQLLLTHNDDLTQRVVKLENANEGK